MHAVELKHIEKKYRVNNKDVSIVKNISFTVEEGSVFGFIGPNGAGKTSTIKMIVGLSQPTKGTVTIFGKNPNDIEVKRRIGFMPESPQFYQYLTGEEFLTMVAELFQLPSKKEKVAAVLKDVDLTHGAHKRIRTFSKGMLQRLGLAQAMINDPDILFLDEPLDGLDPIGRAEVKKIITKLKAKNKTIFINTHILPDVEEVCDKVVIIDQGELLNVGTPKEIISTYKDLESAFVAIIANKRAQK